MADGPEKPKANPTNTAPEQGAEKTETIVPKTPEEKEAIILNEHSREKFEADFRKRVQKIQNLSDTQRKTILDIGVTVYTQEYQRIITELAQEKDKANRDYETAIAEIQIEAQKQRDKIAEKEGEKNDYLEVFRNAPREVWEQSSKKRIEIALAAADREPQQSFIESINKNFTGRKANDFEEAKEILKEELETLMQTAIDNPEDTAKRDAFETKLKAYAGSVNENRGDLLSGLNAPEAIQNMILRERARLMIGVTSPINEQDKLVIRFMNQSSENRGETLNSPEGTQIMRAIKNIKEKYTESYKKTYRKGLEKTKQVTFSRDLENPTRDELAARLLALIMIAGEAEQIVQQTKGNEYAALQADEKTQQIPPNMNFRAANMKHPAKYIPVAMRHGFTMAGIGKAALTVGAWGTLITNVMNYDKSEGSLFSGEKGFNNFINNITSSPYIAGSAAVLYGKKVYERTPEVRKLASLGGISEGESTRIWNSVDNLKKIQIKLNKKGKENGLAALLGSEGGSYEWEIMKQMTPDKMKKLMKDAEKANSKTPMITGSAVKEAIGTGDINNETYLINSNDAQIAHARYLFYKEFLTNKDVNIPKLKQDTKQWLASRVSRA